MLQGRAIAALIGLVVALGMAGPASAMDFGYWDGRWAPASEPQWCNSRRDQTDMQPLVLRLSAPPRMVRAYESHCTVESISPLRDIPGLILDLACSGEGATWSTRQVLLMNSLERATFYTPNATHPGGYSEQRIRCP